MEHPEDGRAPDEWVVFVGEQMSFLTGGALQAPIHGVPAVRAAPEATSSLVRCASPFFLRAAPSAVMTGEPGALSCRELMEQHIIGLRPWRRRGRLPDW